MEDSLIKLEVKDSIWDRFFMVHPLVIIGTSDKSGEINFAPKHMAMPMGWDNYFGFVCSPGHSTYQNIISEKWFNVSFPLPDQVLFTSLAATSREDDDSKPAIKALPMIEIENSLYLRGAYLYLKCELFKIMDDFGQNSLITGKIADLWVRENMLRSEERDENEMIADFPLLAYLHPTRFASIKDTNSFPFPERFSK